MPIDTHQVANVVLSDTFSSWKDRTNEVIKLVNELPAAGGAGITRLGGIIDGGTGPLLSGTQGTLYFISAGKVALGDFLGLNQQTAANNQAKFHLHSESANAVMFLTQNTASKVSAIVFGRRNSQATSGYGSPAGVVGMWSNTSTTHSKLIFAANSYVDSGHPVSGGPGFLSAQQNWWGASPEVGIRLVLDSGEMTGSPEARLNSPFVIWRNKWDDPLMANTTPLLTLTGQSQEFTGREEHNTPIVLRFQDTSVAVRNVVTTHSTQHDYITAPFAALDFGGIDDFGGTATTGAGARISASSLGVDGRSTSLDFWVRTRDSSNYYTDDYYPEMGDGPKLINVMRIMGDSASETHRNLGKVIFSANTITTANALFTDDGTENPYDYPGQVNIIPGSIHQADELRSNGTVWNSGLMISAYPQSYRGESEAAGRARAVPARIILRDPNSNTDHKNLQITYGTNISGETTAIPYDQFLLTPMNDNLGSGNTWMRIHQFHTDDTGGGSSQAGKQSVQFSFGTPNSMTSARAGLSMAGGRDDQTGAAIALYSSGYSRAYMHKVPGAFGDGTYYEDVVNYWHIGNIGHGYNNNGDVGGNILRFFPVGNNATSNSYPSGPDPTGMMVNFVKHANQNTHIGLGTSNPDSELHILRSISLTTHAGPGGDAGLMAPPGEFNANVHIESGRGVELWLEADNLNHATGNPVGTTTKGWAAHPRIRLTQDGMFTESLFRIGGADMDLLPDVAQPDNDSYSNDLHIAHHPAQSGNMHFSMSTITSTTQTNPGYAPKMSIHGDGRMSFGNNAVAGAGGAGSSGPRSFTWAGATVRPSFEFNTSSMDVAGGNPGGTNRNAYTDVVQIRSGRNSSSAGIRQAGLLITMGETDSGGAAGKEHRYMRAGMVLESGDADGDYPSLNFYAPGRTSAGQATLTMEYARSGSFTGPIGLHTAGAGLGLHAPSGAAELVANVTAYVGGPVGGSSEIGMVLSGPGQAATNSAKGALNFVGIGDAVSYSFQTHGDSDAEGPSFQLVEGRQNTTLSKGIDPGAQVTTHISVHSSHGTGEANAIAIGADWFGGGTGAPNEYPGATHKIHFGAASSTANIASTSLIPGKITANGGALFLFNSAAESHVGAGNRPNFQSDDGLNTVFARQSATGPFATSGVVLSPSVWFGTGGKASAHISDDTYAVVGAVMADCPADTLLIGAQEKDMVIRGTATGNILLGSGGGSSAATAGGLHGGRGVNRSGWNLKVDGANSLLTVNNAISMPEQSAADAAVTAPGAGHGKVWVKNDDPTELMFTDSDGADFSVSRGAAYPRGHIDGLQLIHGFNAIAITEGQARSSDNQVNMELTSASAAPSSMPFEKRFPTGGLTGGSWVAGHQSHGLMNNAGVVAETWYHVFVIYNSSTGVTDAGFDTNVTASTLLTTSGFSHYRRIGSIKISNTHLVYDFIQIGDYFRWPSHGFQDVKETLVHPASSAALTWVVSVPLGVQVLWMGSVQFTTDIPGGAGLQNVIGDGGKQLGVPSTDNSDVRLNQSAAGGDGQIGGPILTDLLSGIRTRSGGNTDGVRIQTHGWQDFRGKE